MAYIIPDLNELLDSIKKIREEYLNNNPDRFELLDILDATAEFISELKDTDDNTLKECCLGAYLFCMEHIAAQYRLLNPEYSQGYIYNSGSTFYKLLLKKLNISEESNLTDQEKLAYIVNYYNLISENNEIFNQKLENKGRNAEACKQSIIASIQTSFNKILQDVRRIQKSIPTEFYMDEKLSTILVDYLAESKTGDRKLQAKMALALKNLLPAKTGINDSNYFLSDNQRIKMGLLLTIMQDIKNTYPVRNPKYHSALYRLCLKALNIEDIEDLDPAIRKECLSEFNLFITDYKNVKRLQEKVDELKVKELDEEKKEQDNISSEIIDMRKLSEEMREQIKNGKPSYIGTTSFILTMVILGGIIASAPGYGTGYALGFAISQTHEVVAPKLMVEKLTGSMMSIVFNTNGKKLGFFAANLIVDETLKRGFAKAFETLAVIFGGITGATIGLTVQCTYKGLENLNLLINHLSNHPYLAKSADPQLIKCIGKLPSEVFSEEEKQHFKKITKGAEPDRMFTQKNINVVVDNLLDEKIIVNESKYELL